MRDLAKFWRQLWRPTNVKWPKLSFQHQAYCYISDSQKSSEVCLVKLTLLATFYVIHKYNIECMGLCFSFSCLYIDLNLSLLLPLILPSLSFPWSPSILFLSFHLHIWLLAFPSSLKISLPPLISPVILHSCLDTNTSNEKIMTMTPPPISTGPEQ